MSEQDNSQEAERIFTGIVEYCKTYNIPKDDLFEILEDQKVLPMIRGKATEYIGAAVLSQNLDPREWIVTKLNLNPHPGGGFDEDVSITFRRTGDRFKVETKNAVRGSFRLSGRIVTVPHFQVKCHRSRSNLARQSTTNDRYLVDDFDLLLCNPSNAIFRNRSLDRGLPLITQEDSLQWLRDFYGVQTDDELRRATYDDWRACLPISIADENGVIPRTPRIQMENDSSWFHLDQLPANLRMLVIGN
ncbi:MAG: hypothetical protein F4Y44_04805 [Chloroflexi bacterium]|nr:hypothetical protein [Chloroflexota bacterium]